MAGAEMEQILATVNGSEFGDDNWNEVYMEIQRFAGDWKKIGTMLGIDSHKLDEIGGNNFYRAGDCLGDVLKQWIGQNYNTQIYGVPSWRTLCKALSKALSDQKFVKELAGNHGGVIPPATGGVPGTSNGATAAPSQTREQKLLSEKPNLRDFNMIRYKGEDGKEKKLRILDRGSHCWRTIAAEISDDANLAARLSQAYSAMGPNECLRQLFIEFLSKSLETSLTRDWNGIIRVFENAGEEVLSEEIKTAVLNRI